MTATNVTTTTSVSARHQGYIPYTSVTSYTSWRVCVWAGWVFIVGYILFWSLLGYNMPTLDPSISQADLYAHYVNHSARIKIAMGMSVVFVSLYLVLSAVIARIMQRIEGPDGPLAIVEQLGGGLSVLVGQIPGIAWLVAAFRIEERSPEMVRTLYDFGWLYFDMTYMVTAVQMWAMAYVFLSDKRPVPLVPRWVSWLTIFISFTFFAETLLPFFITGPFAWNGLFNYWVALGGYFVWVVVLLLHLPKAINRLEQEDA